MRLPILSPDALSDEQKPLYADMKQGIQASFKGFVNIRDDGALMGPWNPWLREPKFGKAVWELVKTMVDKPSLPATVPLMPSCASSTLPLSSSSAQSARSGSRKARKSGSAANW